MKHTRSQTHITTLAALSLLAVFAVSILLVLLKGASIYRRMTDRDQESWQARAAYLYVATRLRQEARLDTVAVEDFDGVSALTLGVGGEYLTRLYCYDGALRELYAPAELTLSPGDGEPLLALQGMEPTLADGLLQVELTTQTGAVRQLTLDLSGAKEAGL